MAAPIQSPNTFDIVRRRFERKLDEIQTKIQSNDIVTENQLISELFQTYRDIHENLRDPEQIYLPIDEFDIREVTLFNTPFSRAHRNLRFLLEMHQRLQESQRSSFNYLSALEEVGRYSITKATNRSIDLKIVSETLEGSTVVAGDDFLDSNKIDKGKVTDDKRAELSPLGNALTLKRLSVEDSLENRDALNIEVKGPGGFYEGKKYGRIVPADVVPEGNSFKFETVQGSYSTVQVEGTSAELQSRFEALSAFFESNPTQRSAAGLEGALTTSYGLSVARQSGSFGGLTIDEWEQVAGNFHTERVFSEDVAISSPNAYGDKASIDQRNDDRTVTALNAKVVVKKGLPTEVLEQRMKMVDDNPDTYWQGEVVVDTSRDLNRVRYDEKMQGPVPELDLEQLSTVIQQQYDDRDVEVDITFDLGEAKFVNFITILPVQFHASSYAEVVKLSYSMEGETFIDIPEATDGRFETQLTSDVNSELSSEEVAMSLAPNKFEYSGQGFFAFHPVQARYLRVRLREKSPIPLVYQTLRATFSRSITTTVKKKKWGHVSRRTSTENYSKAIELDYFQTLYLGLGEITREEFLKGALSTSTTNTNRSAGGIETGLTQLGAIVGTATFIFPVIGTIIGAAIGKALGAFLSKNQSVGKAIGKVLGFGSKVRTTDTGWTMSDLSLIPKYDKARYAIGVKEFGAFRFTYSGQSEFISKEFVTPKPISAVSLTVDESIPASLSEDGFKAIRYYFSLDDGANWNEISPLKSGPRASTSGIVPQVYHINSSLPVGQRDPNVGYADLSSPSRRVRFRAVLQRKADESNITPVLKAYRLKLIMEGGL